MKKVLITGITGFIGQNLREHLSKEHQIIGVGRNEKTTYCDIPKLDFDVIVHLAGKAHDLKNVSKPEEYYKINTDLTKQVFDIFLASKAKKFIFVSSIKAVSDSFEGILSEETNANPETIYGKSKLLAENYILNNIANSEKKIYILRPCMVHGPGNKGNLNLLYNFVENGFPYPLGIYDNRRSYLSVGNLCYIINELIIKPINPGIYNLSDDETISTNELVSIISKSLNKKPIILKINKELINFISKIGDKLSLPFNSEKLNKLIGNYQVSNKKITEAIGHSLPISTRKGLEITLSSFKL